MTTLMRNGRDRRSENPFWAIARLERVVVFGTDQRITSGPAATVAASRWRQAFTRKQAAYMAAPERFAKRQIPLAPRAPSIHRSGSACKQDGAGSLGVAGQGRHLLSGACACHCGYGGGL